MVKKSSAMRNCLAFPAKGRSPFSTTGRSMPRPANGPAHPASCSSRISGLRSWKKESEVDSQRPRRHKGHKGQDRDSENTSLVFMPIIETKDLTKVYRVSQKKKGLVGAVRGLFRR